MDSAAITARLRNGRRGRRRPIFVVSFLDLRAHFPEALAFVHHFHHVTRDVYANTSSKAHVIEDRFAGVELSLK